MIAPTAATSSDWTTATDATPAPGPAVSSLPQPFLSTDLAPAGRPAVPGIARSWRHAPRTGLAAAASALLVAWGLAAALELPIADERGPQDWARSLAVSLRHGLPVHSSPWAWVGLSLIGLLAGVHYLLAAVVLRAAAGHRTVPLGAGFLAQLAATAANRMTPVGLGGAAVNTRFLFRRGLSPAGAAGTVAAMGVLGLVADALLALSLWVVGGVVGIPGSRGEVSRLAHEVTTIATRISHGPRWQVALVGAAALITAIVFLRRRRNSAPGPEGALGTALRHAGGLARRPIDLAVLLLASAGTTAVLAAAMVVSVRTVGAGAAAGAGAVLMAYLVGAAAGNMVPVPAGIASTEAALATALIAAGVSAVHAVSAVVLYRTITFWGPVPAGLLAARSLRRRRLL